MQSRKVFVTILRVAVVFTVAVAGDFGQARVVTAPTSADQRLINPAVSALRDTLGFSIDAGKQEDEENVLGLTRASLGIKTKIESLNTNSVLRTGNYFWELSVSPQKGSKDTTSLSESNSGPNNNFPSSQLSITPLQAIVSTKLGSNLSFGLKMMYTAYSFKDATIFTINKEAITESSNESRDLSGSFVVLAPGFVYQLGGSGFAFAYVSEFFQFQNSQATVGNTELIGYENFGFAEYINTDTKTSDTITARKDIVGLGYTKKFSGGNSFRAEASYEKMPPLTKVQGYPYGQIVRVIGELNFLYFRVGIEATRQTGYYVDPYNSIPYFFKIDHLGLDPVTEYGFFGGLKTSKGHGFGASYSQTKSIAPRKLSVGGSEQEVEKKSTKMGVSYSYFF